MENIHHILAALRQTAAARVAATVYGSSDEWSGIEEVDVADERGHFVPVGASVEQAVARLFERTTCQVFGGYENDSGGRVECDLDVATGRIRATFYPNVMERDEHSFAVLIQDDARLAAIFAATPGTGSASILIEGYGDSGCVEEADAAAEPFEAWAMEWLNRTLPGWEINDGGGAEFTIDFDRRAVYITAWTNEEGEGEPQTVTIDLVDDAEEAAA